MYNSSTIRTMKFELVSFRFVNPTSFVYGPKEENEPETCMAEKMNFTFHVRRVVLIFVAK